MFKSSSAFVLALLVACGGKTHTPAATTNSTGAATAAAWYCATFTRADGDPADRSHCEHTEAECAAKKAAFSTPNDKASTNCASTTQAFCYTSTDPSGAASTLCYATNDDCAAGRKVEEEHNRQSPTLSACAETR